MAKLKVKEIEGEAADINQLFKNGNCDLASYLGATPPPKKIHERWLWLTIMAFLGLALCISLNPSNYYCKSVGTIGLFFFWSLIIFMVQYNHKKWPLTTISFVGGLIVIILALKIYSPEQVVKKLEQLTTERYEHH